jgi:hypothetical protein
MSIEPIEATGAVRQRARSPAERMRRYRKRRRFRPLLVRIELERADEHNGGRGQTCSSATAVYSLIAARVIAYVTPRCPRRPSANSIVYPSGS